MHDEGVRGCERVWEGVRGCGRVWEGVGGCGRVREIDCKMLFRPPPHLLQMLLPVHAAQLLVARQPRLLPLTALHEPRGAERVVRLGHPLRHLNHPPPVARRRRVPDPRGVVKGDAAAATAALLCQRPIVRCRSGCRRWQ